MNSISHKQAIQFIDRRMDEMLDESQQTLLDEHLHSCDSCRAYSSEMEMLAGHLNQEFKTRWDKHSEPSQSVFGHVTSNAKRMLMANRLSSSLRLVAGVVGLLLLAFAINLIVSRLQSTSIASRNATPTPSNPANLVIDPQSCKSTESNSAIQPPSELYGYNIIQSTSLNDGDFTYEFWLYCDPSLKPDDEKQLNAISGLGISASWHYTGPRVEGETQYHYEFEPNVPLGTSGVNGPFYKVSATGAKFGIDISQATVQTHIQQGTPIEFRVIIDSPLGRNGATLSFHLEPTRAGLKIAGLQAASIHPVGGDLLAFSSLQTGNSEIYTMNADGSGLTNLTNDPADDSNPNWSPDGQHIAFVSDRDGTAQIYLMDADGSNVTQLTHNQSDHYLSINVDNKYNPWSPDGSKILFIEYSSDNDLWNLYEIGIDGQNQTPLASSKQYFTSVSWSPDGKYVAVAFNDSPDPNISFVPDIYVFEANGNNSWQLKALIPQNETLDLPYYWSSDGKSIIFVANQQDRKHQTVYEFNFPTDSLTQVEIQKSRVVDWQTGTSLIFDTEKAMPTFIWQKSDGRSTTQEWNLRNCLFDFTKSSQGNLAVGGFCNDTNKFELYWANADGSASKQLYASAAFNDTYQMADITWSPDDRYVTFMLGSDTQTRLYILNVQNAMNNPSTQPREIEIGADQMHAIPSWRPRTNDTAFIKPAPIPSFDNRLIAFTSPQAGNSDIFVMNTDGTNIRNLTNDPATDRNPVWSPDGQKIAFESDRNGRFDIYVMNADGSDLTQVTTDSAFDSLAPSYDSPWSPDGKQILVQSNRSGHDALYVISIDGKGEAVKIGDTSGLVAWSPNGSQIAYSYISENSGLNNNSEQDAIRIVNSDGSNEQNIVQTGLIRNIHWSADGQTFYYLNGAMAWEIVRVDATDGKSEVILNAEDSHVLGTAWFGTDSTIVYQGIDPQGRLSLFRFNAGKSALVGQYADELKSCQGMASGNTILSHDTAQAISYLICDSGQVTFTMHDLSNNTSTSLGNLSLVNPEIQVDWSQDDQVIAIRIVQSDVSLSSGVQASLYVLRRDELSQPLSRLKPVIEQTNGLTQVVIQPILTK